MSENLDPRDHPVEAEVVREVQRAVTFGTGPAGTSVFVVLFSDIEGFTSVGESKGEAVARRLRQAHDEIVQAAVSRGRAGRVVKSVGDGMLAVLHRPSTAVERAIEIQREIARRNAADDLGARLAVRIGLHMGEVSVEGTSSPDVFGRHVNRAARVMSLAAGGQIFMTAPVYDNARDWVSAESAEDLVWADHGEWVLKGVGPNRIYEVADRTLGVPRPPAEGVRASAEPAASPGTRLAGPPPGPPEVAGYEVLDLLGEGAMGSVWRARDPRLDRLVAVKILDGADGDEARRRFEREGRAIAALRHPAIVQVHGLVETPRGPAIVMEHVDGDPLDEAAADLDIRGRAALVAKVVRAVAYAHGRGVVHRDLKPGNIVVDEAGEPFVLDFGLARVEAAEESRQTKMTAAGAILGTPAYAAPEQLGGDGEVGPAADVYALGAILFEILTGRPPFEAPTVSALIDKVLRADPPFPREVDERVPEPLQRVCLKALEKRPADRYPSADTMADDIDRWLAGEPVWTRPSLYADRLRMKVAGVEAEIDRWRAQNLVTVREHDGLKAAFDRLLVEEEGSLLETRRLRLDLVLAYLGGLLSVVSCLLWVRFVWGDLAAGEGILVVGLPAATLTAVGWAVWRRERRGPALAFLTSGGALAPVLAWAVLTKTGILSSPLSIDGADAELLGAEASATWGTNRQFLWAALAGLAWNAWFTRATRATSAMTLAALTASAAYVAGLLQSGAMTWTLDTVGLRLLPLSGVALAAALLAERGARRALAAPLFAAALVWLVAGLSLFALHAPADRWMMEGENAVDMTKILFSMNGILYVALTCISVRLGTYVARRAFAIFAIVGALHVLVPLSLLADRWGVGRTMGAAEVTVPEVLLPLACLGLVGLSVLVQIKQFLYYGYVYLAVEILHFTARHYPESRWWPATFLAAGTAALAAALVLARRAEVPEGER